MLFLSEIKSQLSNGVLHEHRCDLYEGENKTLGNGEIRVFIIYISSPNVSAARVRVAVSTWLCS